VSSPEPDETLDTFGLLCPIPIIRLADRMKVLPPGAVVAVISDDPGIEMDLPAWCTSTGHELLVLTEDPPGEFRGVVRRGAAAAR